MSDPALDFWLRHVAAEGGLSEPAGDALYVVLPPALSDRYRLPEELRVTADPDVGRDEGVTLLALGHPVLSDAAERTLAAGDGGTLILAKPASAPPSADVLLSAVRDEFGVDHGRIDASGEPEAVLHAVVRVGALVTFELSAEDRFGEQAERWVDVPSRRLLPAGITERLARAATDAGVTAEPPGATPPDGTAAGELWPAVAEAHRMIDAAALARRETLAGEVNGACQAERSRAIAYYADAIAGIERRLATAPGDRRAVLAQRLRSTREEQARRLAEIAEKYAASHAIRPYRLHVIAVPALRLSADVRRGDRRYPMAFDWLLPAGAFAPVRCPSCGSQAPLVAGKQKLGCETCLPPRADQVPAPAPAPPPRKAAPTAKPGRASGTVPPARPGAPPKAATPPKAAPPPKAAQPGKAPPVPPHVKRARHKTPAKIAEELWTAVAAGLRGNAGPLLEPGSPASVLYEIFGAPGLTQVIGMPAEVPPYRCTAREWRLAGSADLAAGTLIGTDDSEHNYYLSHRDGLVTEVLPCPQYDDGELWKSYWWGEPGDHRWAPRRIPRGAGLDPVGMALLGTGPCWHGLPVAARAVAAWERIPDAHERVLAGRRPHVVAAAVDRLVAYRAGGRTTFADAAAAYRADDQAIRQADRAVRPLLALGPGRPW